MPWAEGRREEGGEEQEVEEEEEEEKHGNSMQSVLRPSRRGWMTRWGRGEKGGGREGSREGSREGPREGKRGQGTRTRTWL
jgi:hypothetical protein